MRRAVLHVLPAVALLLLMFVAAMVQRQPSAAQTPTALGVDTETIDNTDTSIPSTAECTSVDIGDTFEVDIYITNVDDLIAYELYFGFDGAIIEVTGHNLRRFLASTSGSQVFTEKDPVPNSSGRHFLGAADARAPDSGSGVLARLTLTAKAAGQSPATVLPIYIWPQLTGAGSQAIGDTNGDKVFDGPLHQAEIAVGMPCSPPVPTPTPTPTPPSTSPSPTPPPSGTPAPGTPTPTPAAPGPGSTPPPAGEDEGASGNTSAVTLVSAVPQSLPGLTDSTLTPIGEDEGASGDASAAALASLVPPSLPGLTDSTPATFDEGPGQPDTEAEPGATPAPLTEASDPGAADTTPAAGAFSSPSGGGGGGLPLWLFAPIGLLVVAVVAGGLLIVISGRGSNRAR